MRNNERSSAQIGLAWALVLVSVFVGVGLGKRLARWSVGANVTVQLTMAEQVEVRRQLAEQTLQSTLREMEAESKKSGSLAARIDSVRFGWQNDEPIATLVTALPPSELLQIWFTVGTGANQQKLEAIVAMADKPQIVASRFLPR